MSGTSAATPHAAAGVVLAVQLKPDLSYEQLLSLLRKTSKDIGYPADVQGAGRINVEKLVNMLRRTSSHREDGDEDR